MKNMRSTDSFALSMNKKNLFRRTKKIKINITTWLSKIIKNNKFIISNHLQHKNDDEGTAKKASLIYRRFGQFRSPIALADQNDIKITTKQNIWQLKA